MISPTKDNRSRKRSSPSTTDENLKPKNLSPSKLLSPISSIKKMLWRETEEDEESTHNKKQRRDDLGNGFITSSPNIKKNSNPGKGERRIFRVFFLRSLW